MLKFNMLPPTAETTEVDANTIRRLAYSFEDRCINNVAETCAAIVVANTSNLVQVAAIGDKIGQVLDTTKPTPNMKRYAKTNWMDLERDDGPSFVHKYRSVAEWLLKTELPLLEEQTVS